MKFITLALLWLAIVPQCSWAESLHMMSWNLRYDNPGDGANAWKHRKDWVAEIIVKNDVDIAGFQEVLAGQLDDLKQRLPKMDACGVGRDDGQEAGEFSPIFFSRDRFERIEQSTFWLSSTPEIIASKGWDAALPRIASWVKLKERKTESQFYVINTHFDHRGEQARTESAALLLDRLRTQFADLPVILTGDFNTTPDSAPYKKLTHSDAANQRVYLDAHQHSARKPEGPNSTWNGFEAIIPNRRIDFIFTTKPIKVLRHRILDDQRDERFPSDHLPVATELDF